MTKFLSILFNLVLLVSLVMVIVENFAIPLLDGTGVEFIDYILVAFLVYFALYLLITIIKKLRALSKESIIGSAFAIKRDIIPVAIVIGATVSEVTSNPFSPNSVVYIVLSVLGIIGIICTASVAKKYKR